jgi:hypothetical protein
MGSKNDYEAVAEFLFFVTFFSHFRETLFLLLTKKPREL